MFNNIGLGEILIVVIVVLFLFGGDKLPEIAKGIGQSSKELKKVKEEIEKALSDIKGDKDPQDKTPEGDSTPKGGESDNV